MSGPWEDYAKLKTESGPWDDYAKGPDEIIQEMHPDIGIGQRFILKNFGSDSASSADWLKQKLKEEKGKDYDVKVSGNGQILVKAPEEKAYRVVDPEGVTGVGEFVMDMTDAGWDVASGLAEGFGAAGAGVAAGLATGGAAALPAAAAAGGTLGAGLEAVRQGIGVSQGVAPEMSGTDIAISGGLGALSPLLFGTGAAAGKISAKAGAQEGKEAIKAALDNIGIAVGPGKEVSQTLENVAKKELERGQKGLFNKVIGGKLTTALSGIPEDTLKKANEIVPDRLRTDLLEQGLELPERPITYLELADYLEQGDPTKLAASASSEIIDALNERKFDIGEQINEAMGSMDITFNVSQYSQSIKDLQKAMEQSYRESPTPALGKKLSEVKQIINEYFTQTRNIVDDFGEVKTIKEPVKAVSASTFMDIKNAIADDLIDYNMTFRGSENLGKGGRKMRKAAIETEKMMSKDLNQVMQANTDKDLFRAYRENEQLRRRLIPKFEDESKALKTLRNLGTKANRTIQADLSHLDELYGTALSDKARMANVWQYFGDAALTTVPGEGTGKVLKGGVLGGLIGSAAGYLGAQGLGMPSEARSAATMGGMGGVGLGSFLTSPAAIKFYLKQQAKGDKAARFIGNMAPEAVTAKLQKVGKLYNHIPIAPMALPTAWQYMNPKGGE